MNILIIEDDELKHTHLEKFAKTLLPKSNFTWKKSYQSGLQEILSNSYDLVLLDMSMHIYEKTAQETGGSFETYAGRMILNEIDMNEIATKVIVITGYDVYNDGKTLATLKKEMRDEFGDFYLDTVYFIGSEDKWKTELTQLIKQYFPNLFMVSKINTYLSILLVEDNEHKAEKVKNFIEDICTNTKILIAKDQMQALQHLISEKFDLMLLDMQLPVRFNQSEPQSNGGENILSEIDINEDIKLPYKIVALTEFDELQSNIRETYPELGAIKFDTTSKKWEDSLLRTMTSLAKSKHEQRVIVYCEEQNDKLYNLIGFENIEFRGLKGGSRKVYEAAKFEKDKFAIRDRDYLTSNEINWLTKSHFNNYIILDYYCFENYVFHPDNLEEYLQSKNIAFDRVAYISNMIEQKNEKFLKIVQDYQSARNSYFDFTDNEKKCMDKNPEKEIVVSLKSDDWQIFYPYFDMKGTDKSKSFDKTYLGKYNLKQEDLVKTKWFKQQMEKVLEKALTK